MNFCFLNICSWKKSNFVFILALCFTVKSLPPTFPLPLSNRLFSLIFPNPTADSLRGGGGGSLISYCFFYFHAKIPGNRLFFFLKIQKFWLFLLKSNTRPTRPERGKFSRKKTTFEIKNQKNSKKWQLLRDQKSERFQKFDHFWEIKNQKIPKQTTTFEDHYFSVDFWKKKNNTHPPPPPYREYFLMGAFSLLGFFFPITAFSL